MEEKDNFELFCTLLDQVLSQRTGHIEVVRQPGKVEARLSWAVDAPLLIVCLSGHQSVLKRRGEHTVAREQVARDGLVVAPGCWLGADPQKFHELLQIRFKPNTTDFVYQPAEKHETRKSVLVLHRSPCRLDASGHEIYRLLLTPPLIREQDYRRGLFEALLCKARESLVAAPSGSKSYQTWQSACHFIEEHCQEAVSRESVASFLRVHPNYISQLFAAQGSESFSEFLLRVRLERARHLLQSPGLNVAEIAHHCGFPDASYFTRVFKKRYGVPPGRARQGREVELKQ